MTQRLRVLEDWNAHKLGMIETMTRLGKELPPPEQWKIMRIMFYRGWAGCFKTLIANVSDGDNPQPEDITMMSDMDKELLDFVDETIEGTFK